MNLGYLHLVISRCRGWTAPIRAAQLAVAFALLLVPVTAAASTAPSKNQAESGAKTHSLYQSRNLWATLDICDPADRPHAVGVRGSMPSDGHSKDTMYMRFQLQYLDSTTQKWVDLGKSSDSGFITLGSAVTARQAGRTFELVPSTGTYTLRGYVEFQWRRANKTVHEVARATSAGHTSLAGADPANFSAATCTLS
jgi:hypothetical protein